MFVYICIYLFLVMKKFQFNYIGSADGKSFFADKSTSLVKYINIYLIQVLIFEGTP